MWQFQILIYVPLKFSQVFGPPPPPPPPFQNPAYATECEALSFIVCGRQTGRWELNSKTAKSFSAASWPRQLGELSYNEK